ncbi:condensin complex subunit SMC2 [Gymnopilus junonius]|uniref:Structural maintenance of chromosomes protein n=1 Tax=Gymnopilus junonius TaxID=109634 RepID=A0A9P5NS22_GYMJU|nr:condensin complex subunit SMC2 [Gymnopilus junonius]
MNTSHMTTTRFLIFELQPSTSPAMRIEELIIEGFKSYPVRTQITGWDPSFNAITGLNGSGKSNILDAICFVLGITNWQQMRANNQQDLIYKRGQAGITKASVTIVFDNSDPAKSPDGYAGYKQITVTRQIGLPNVSKYLLNGHKAQQSTIQTIFQSVQLNINNPNFLIMQGRITKVLNMRPQEILGMVEEAAGTRMFEDRKDKAKKTMGKKEKRVQELKITLEEEIKPKLDKLRQEKRSFIQYQKTASELERIGRALRAYEWYEGWIEQVKSDKAQAEKEIKDAEKEVVKVSKKRDAEMSKGGKLKKLQEEVGDLGKVVAKHKAQLEIKGDTINDEEKKVVTLEKQLKDAGSTLTKKQKEVEKVQTTTDHLKEKHATLESKLQADEELLQTLLTGLSSAHSANKGKGGGYMGAIADAGNASPKPRRRKNKGRMRAFAKEAKDNEKRLGGLKAEVKALEERVAKTGWSAERERELEGKLREAREQVKTLTEHRERIKSRIPRLNFDYEDPSPNFDRRKEHFNKATALEIAGGGKLYNVVIEDEKVGKELIKNGHMRKRVTFIPLAKITAWTLSDHKLNAAKHIAPNKVRTALSLVGYTPEVQKAIAYIFSDTLICDDSDAARKVTFAREVSVRSVTFDGDVYDPSGTLSGGSAPKGDGILVQVQELLQVEERLEERRRVLRELEGEEERGKKGRGWGSNAALNASEVERVRSTITSLRQAVQTAKEKQTEAQEECKKLERDMDEFKNNKDGKLTNGALVALITDFIFVLPIIQASIIAQKAAVQKHAVTVKTQQKELQTAALELEQLEGDISGEKEQLEEAKEGIETLKKDLEKLHKQLAASEDEHSKAEEKLSEEMATLSRFDTELKELERVIKEKKAVIQQADLNVTELQHSIEVLETEKTKAMNVVARLEQQHEWIAHEKDQFNKPGTQYDFSSVDVEGLRKKAQELESSQEGLKKKVNPKVMNMIESVEKREAELIKNMAIVEKDKEKIEDTIDELDRYKREALQKTWEKVSTDFGGIFAELLPGNFAKLQPPEGQDLMDGLEVKVQLGSVWKQSLTELSGGQRSLIALSLIMALLQFKPAPMYILDEIDAALDLSHTQHIGQLFRTRFKGSQFIVVSLKEGLFTNANVLFRARFHDGTSLVERTAQRSTSALYANGNGNEDEEDRRNSRRRRVAGS